MKINKAAAATGGTLAALCAVALVGGIALVRSGSHHGSTGGTQQVQQVGADLSTPPSAATTSAAVVPAANSSSLAVVTHKVKKPAVKQEDVPVTDSPTETTDPAETAPESPTGPDTDTPSRRPVQVPPITNYPTPPSS